MWEASRGFELEQVLWDVIRLGGSFLQLVAASL